MKKTVLVTGSTDGIGLEAARMLVSLDHYVLLHGRNPKKLEEVEKALSALSNGGRVGSYVSDLSRMTDVEALAKAVSERHAKLDVIINNAGVFRTPDTITEDGLDDEFAAASGRYFDNDAGRFASPHPDALDPHKSQEIVRAIEAVLA